MGRVDGYCYHIAVVDTSAKPPQKVKEHFKVEQSIAEYWRTRQAAATTYLDGASTLCPALHVCQPMPSHRLRPPHDASPSAAASPPDTLPSMVDHYPCKHTPGSVPCTLVVAFGTRGDVIPLRNVAHALVRIHSLASGGDGRTIIFATHECHRHLVMTDEAHGDDDLVTGEAQVGEGCRGHGGGGGGRGSVGERGRHTPALVFVGAPTDPLRPSIGVRSCCSRDESGTAVDPVDTEYEPLLSVISRRPVGLVIFNLFSLGAWHIADALGAPSIAISPCVIPYGPPAQFEERFRVAHPELYAALVDAPSGCISWGEVAHWMWPLWDVGRWGGWRRRRLGVSESPLVPCNASAASPPRLPTATPLLYCLPSALVPRPAFWPASVRTIGHIAATGSAAAGPDAARAVARCAPLAAALLAAHTSLPPIYVGFGSSSPLLLISDATGAHSGLAMPVLHGTFEAALALGCPLLLHCCGCEDLWSLWCAALIEAGCQESAETCARDPIAIQEDAGSEYALRRTDVSPGITTGCNERCFVRGHLVVLVIRAELTPLEWVLVRCQAAIHHGGAGTCVSAARAAVPQLVLPLVFDQFANAERLEYMGIGTRLQPAALCCHDAAHTQPTAGSCAGERTESASTYLIRALRRMAARGAGTCFQGTGGEVVAEDGLSVVVDIGRSLQAEPAISTASSHSACSALPLPPYASSEAMVSSPEVAGAPPLSASVSAGGATAAVDARHPRGQLHQLLDAARRWKRARTNRGVGHGLAGRGPTEGDATPEASARAGSAETVDVAHADHTTGATQVAHAAEGTQAEAANGTRVAVETVEPLSAHWGVSRAQLPGGLVLLCHSVPEVLYCFDEIFVRRCYLPDGSGIELPASSDTLVVDVGANVGVFAIWAARIAPRAKIIALEPAPRTFELLQRNLSAHPTIAMRVSALPLALGAARGRRELSWYPRMPGNSTFFPEEKEEEASRCFRAERRSVMLGDSERVSVEVRTLSDVLCGCVSGGQAPGETRRSLSATAQISLLKVDAEGAEIEVLRGIADADWPRIAQVVVETHGEMRNVQVVRLLATRYDVVASVADSALAECGLERAIVYARCPRSPHSARSTDETHQGDSLAEVH